MSNFIKIIFVLSVFYAFYIIGEAINYRTAVEQDILFKKNEYQLFSFHPISGENSLSINVLYRINKNDGTTHYFDIPSGGWVEVIDSNKSTASLKKEK